MKTAKVTIRPATAADNALLAELGAQTFADTFAGDNTPANMAAYLAASFSPAKQAAELADPASVFLIAEVGGVVAGYARLKLGPPPPGVTGAQPIEIVRFYARQEWQGQGIGAALMKACLSEAERRSCDTIWLDVWERNNRARTFYQKWAFVEVGSQIFQLGDDLQQDLVLQRAVKIVE